MFSLFTRLAPLESSLERLAKPLEERDSPALSSPRCSCFLVRPCFSPSSWALSNSENWIDLHAVHVFRFSTHFTFSSFTPATTTTTRNFITSYSHSTLINVHGNSHHCIFSVFVWKCSGWSTKWHLFCLRAPPKIHTWVPRIASSFWDNELFFTTVVKNKLDPYATAIFTVHNDNIHCFLKRRIDRRH